MEEEAASMSRGEKEVGRVSGKTKCVCVRCAVVKEGCQVSPDEGRSSHQDAGDQTGGCELIPWAGQWWWCGGWTVRLRLCLRLRLYPFTSTSQPAGMPSEHRLSSPCAMDPGTGQRPTCRGWFVAPPVPFAQCAARQVLWC